ncbi:MAG TPA: prepilin-type N-terminal cleavage/methylation domain-containing protein [Nitrospira sp.]|nr:prepilin-type N-terminal cleavage/methylation domain-containing protein [Nitrospira sp.]
MLYQKQTAIQGSKENQQGFTLLEIMIVTVIIGIAAALAVPNFTMMYARHELYQATTSLYNRLVFARSAAISRNSMIVATPANVPGAQSQVTFTAPLGVETLPLNVNFVLPLPATPIGFTPRGLSTTPLATSTVQLQSVRDPTLIYSISLAPSGKVTWCNRQITPCIQNQ